MQARLWMTISAAFATTFAAALAFGQAKEIRIAFVYDKTGPLEAYVKQTQTGFMMGLDYATGGTLAIVGKKIKVIERDSQGKPDVATSQLAAAYAEAGRFADAVRTAEHAVALARQAHDEAASTRFAQQLEYYRAGLAFHQ